MELFKASNQWATRPADERFWNLKEMLEQTRAYRDSACEAVLDYSDVRVEAQDGEVLVKGKRNIPARLTNWAFGQLCQRAGAPAGYLRELPATLAAQNVNHGLSENREREQVKMLFHKNGDFVLRAANGTGYSRIWNSDIVSRLVDIEANGWKVPPARPAGIDGEKTRVATKADVLEHSLRSKNVGGAVIKEGDVIAPAGLYASDHDMFAFMVNENAIVDDGSGHGLARGFFIWNSEVGASSFGITTFLYDAICGNHIVWGAKGVHEIRIRHVGEANSKAFYGIRAELIKYANESVSDLEAKIKSARAFEFGATKEDAVSAALAYATKVRANGINRATLGNAYDIAEEVGRYGAPGSAWGLVNGLTELSQTSQYADQRVAIDRAAGKLMEVAF